MTQNIYDDPGFFAGYGRLRRSIDGLDGAPEWPALRAMLPISAGARFSIWAAASAGSAVGARPGSGACARHRRIGEHADAGSRRTADPAIVYARADLENDALPDGPFDLAYGSLVLHYIEHLDRLFGAVRDALAPGGRFVFSVEHPIYTAPSRPGWVTLDGRGIWPVDSYLIEGTREYGLARQRCAETAPNRRSLCDRAAAARLRADPSRGMGSRRRADRGPSGIRG